MSHAIHCSKDQCFDPDIRVSDFIDLDNVRINASFNGCATAKASIKMKRDTVFIACFSVLRYNGKRYPNNERLLG